MDFTFLTLGYHPDLIGGAYRLVQELAVRLAARSERVEAIYPAPNRDLPAVELRAGVWLRRFPNASGFFLRNWRQENRAARALLADRRAALTVLCHAYLGPALPADWPAPLNLFTGPWAAEYQFARRGVRRPLWLRWRDELIAEGMRRAERRALRRSWRIMTISRYYAENLPRWHGAGLPPVTVIPCGVDAERFQPAPDRAGLRRSLGLAPDDFLFLTVRRLDPRMGLLGLIDGFARVAGEHPRARLWLAGSGPQKDELAARVAALGLRDRTRLLGFVPEADLTGILSAADCALMPSLDLEGFGLATVEALACGTPVLGSRAGATPEILAPLGEQCLFPAGSPDALAARLGSVLSDPRSLPDRATCREYVLRNYSWETAVAAFENAWGDWKSGPGRV